MQDDNITEQGTENSSLIGHNGALMGRDYSGYKDGFGTYLRHNDAPCDSRRRRGGAMPLRSSTAAGYPSAFVTLNMWRTQRIPPSPR